MKFLDLLSESTFEIIAYHGTDYFTKDIKSFKFPLWISSDIGLAIHFALRPSSSSKEVAIGYVYKLKILNPIGVKKDKKRFLLESCDKISIVEIGVYEPHPITFAKKIKTINF